MVSQFKNSTKIQDTIPYSFQSNKFNMSFSQKFNNTLKSFKNNFSRKPPQSSPTHPSSQPIKPMTLKDRFLNYDLMSRSELIELIVDIIKTPEFKLNWGNHQTAVDCVIVHYLKTDKQNRTTDLIKALEKNAIKIDDYLFYRRLSGLYANQYHSILSDRCKTIQNDCEIFGTLTETEFSKSIDQLRESSIQTETDEIPLIRLLKTFDKNTTSTKKDEIFFLANEGLLEHFYGYQWVNEFKYHQTTSLRLAFEQEKPIKVIKFIYNKIKELDSSFVILANDFVGKQIQISIRKSVNLKHFRYFTETMGFTWEPDHYLIGNCCYLEKFEIIHHLLKK